MIRYSHVNSSAFQAMAAYGSQQQVVVNNVQPVINDTTNLSKE